MATLWFDALPVHMMNPLVGRLPNDGPDPQGQVGGHQVHESESGKQSEPFHYHLRVDKEEVHLEKGEEGLEDGMGDEDVFDAALLHGGMHGNFQPRKDQGSQTKDWMDTKKSVNEINECVCLSSIGGEISRVILCHGT